MLPSHWKLRCMSSAVESPTIRLAVALERVARRDVRRQLVAVTYPDVSRPCWI